MKLLKRVGAVGSYTLLSRVFGFLRDILMARYLGAGAASDAFFIAFKLPNFFRRLFAEGAFSAGFVPLFAALLGKDQNMEDQEKAHAFARSAISWLFPILLFVLIIMEVMMVPVMKALTGGFAGDPEKFNLAVLLGRLVFPYLLFISLATLISAILNAYGRFSAAAFSPVILNIFMITALLVWGNEGNGQTAAALSIAVSLAGLAQMVWLYVCVRRLGVKLWPGLPRWDSKISKLLKLVGPAAIGAGIIQVNLLVDVILAARFLEDGAVSWLFYGDRLNQLPLGVIGVALGTVLLPVLTQHLTAGEFEKANETQNNAVLIGLLLTLPAAAALITIGAPIITTLFERAAFTASDSMATSAALQAYALGLPAYILIKVFTPGYHARQDTKTPVKIAAVALLINVSVNLLLIGPLGHVGLALGTAISAWSSAFLLFFGLSRRGHLRIEPQTWSKLARALVASIGMAATLWSVFQMPGDMSAQTEGIRIAYLALLVLVGLITYGVLAFLLKLVSRQDVNRFLRRTPEA